MPLLRAILTHPLPMDAPDLFQANLALIARTIARVARRAQLSGGDAEDFGSSVRLHLIDDDYAVLRAFEGRCSLETYVTIVAQRFLAQERNRAWGRWHESTAAKRMGEVAVALEKLVRREGRTLEEALPLLRDLQPGLTRAEAEAMLAELPERRTRPREIDAAAVEKLLVAVEDAQERVVSSEIRADSARAARAIRQAMAMLPTEERMLLRFRFESGLAISEIARIMNVEQRPLYRQMERVLRTLRDSLARVGIDRRTAADLIGSSSADMDFGLRDPETGAASSSMKKEGP